MALSQWEKGLWQIWMHHWTVHAKVEFSRFPPDVRTKGSIPQLLILNSEMNLKIFPILGGHSTTVDPELRNQFKNVSTLGINSTTVDPELRNEFKDFSTLGGPFHNC